MLSNGLFYTPLTGATRQEIEAGMAGKDETHYQRMLTELGDQAQLADELGYDKLAISEHHFQVEGFEVPNNPVLLNVHLAGLTKRIKLGQLGILAAARHPLLVAEDIVMLDHITRGRCFVGLARGAHTRAVDVLGTKFGAHAPHPAFADAVARHINLEQFEESFEIMQAAWTQDTFSHQGKYWTLPPDDVYFKHPGTDRYGAGQNADSEAEARKSAEAVAWAWGEWLGGYGFNEAFRLPGETGAVPNDFDVTQRDQGFIVYGTPDQVAERLQPFVERYNVEELFNWVFNGVMSNDEVLKSFRLYAEDVAPRLNTLTAGVRAG